MTTEEWLQLARYFNLAWASVLFLSLVYFGVLDVVLNRQCKNHHKIRELELWALAAFAGIIAIIFSLSEVLIRGTEPGWRVLSFWPYFIVTTVALCHGAVRVHRHRLAVARGECR